MRKSLWIVPLLFVAIVVPCANADSITDPAVITKFECCDGATVPIFDLEITFNAPITGFGSNLSDCTTTGVGTGTVTLTCKNGIPVGQLVSTQETTAGTFALAWWSDAKGSRVTRATPTPEPATGGLILTGIGILTLRGNAGRLLARRTPLERSECKRAEIVCGSAGHDPHTPSKRSTFASNRASDVTND